MINRRISFEKINNCRDLGGLTNNEGAAIRSGVLFRSAKLFKASDSDLKKLSGELALKRVIDLRTSMEVAEKPDKPVPGAEHIHIAVFDDMREGISHEEETDNKSDMFISDMARLYVSLVTDPFCQKNFARILRIIFSHDPSSGSILWHCTEGKDRCGLVTMFVLSALDVDRETILDDYLLTNEVNVARAEMIYQRCMAKGIEEKTALQIRESFLAKEEYLCAAMQVIDTSFNGMGSYLRNTLGISDSEIRAFQEKMLV